MNEAKENEKKNQNQFVKIYRQNVVTQNTHKRKHTRTLGMVKKMKFKSV